MKWKRVPAAIRLSSSNQLNAIRSAASQGIFAMRVARIQDSRSDPAGRRDARGLAGFRLGAGAGGDAEHDQVAGEELRGRESFSVLSRDSGSVVQSHIPFTPTAVETPG